MCRFRAQLNLGHAVRAVAFGTGNGAGQHVVAAFESKLHIFDVSSDGKLDLAPWRRYKRLIAPTTSPEESLRSLKEICDSAPSFSHRFAPPWLQGLTALHFAGSAGFMPCDTLPTTLCTRPPGLAMPCHAVPCCALSWSACLPVCLHAWKWM